ncbi:MAG: exosortase A [Steroidobacteraceae bacterium]
MLPTTAAGGERSALFVRGCNVGLALTLSIVLATAALYSASFDSLFRAWSDTDSHTYTHGVLIVVISLALLIWRRAELRSAPITTNGWAVILIAVCAFSWLVGLRAPIQIIHQLALPLILWSAVWSLLGWPIARLCLFPLAYIYFAIPIWDHGNDVLQSMSVLAVRGLLRATSIPAYFEGELIEIPAGTFHIEDGCSGLHFFIVALALASLYGEVNRCSGVQRLKLLVLATVCALVRTWLRVYLIIVAGHLSQMQHSLVRVDHYYFGWAVFAVAMVCFFVVAARWLPDVTARNDDMPPTVARVRSSGDIGLRTIIVMVLCAAPAWYGIARGFAVPELAVNEPASVADWSGPYAIAEPDGRYGLADARIQVRYAQADRSIELTIAGFREQAVGKKISGYGAQPLGQGETVLSRTEHTTASGAQFAESEIQGATDSTMLSWVRYEVGTQRFVSPAVAQLAFGVRSLAGTPPLRVVELRTLCTPDCGASRNALERFTRQSEP